MARKIIMIKNVINVAFNPPAAKYRGGLLNNFAYAHKLNPFYV